MRYFIFIGANVQYYHDMGNNLAKIVARNSEASRQVAGRLLFPFGEG